MFFNRVRLDGPLPGKNDNMAAMTLAVGVAYREIYSWKAAILYRRFVVKIHTHQPATENRFPSCTMLRNGSMTCLNMQASTYTGHASSEDSSLFITDNNYK